MLESLIFVFKCIEVPYRNRNRHRNNFDGASYTIIVIDIVIDFTSCLYCSEELKRSALKAVSIRPLLRPEL